MSLRPAPALVLAGVILVSIGCASGSSAPVPAPAAAPAPAGRAGVAPPAPAPAAAPKPVMPALPYSLLKLPAGFSIATWASDVKGARSLALGPGGTVFVGTRVGDAVVALRDADGDGVAEQRRKVASGLAGPNGVAVKDGALYVAEISRILRFDGIEAIWQAEPRMPPPAVVTKDYPKEEWHGWKFIAFGPDGLLYVPVGAPCNICDPPEPFASITRIKPDGTGREVVHRGIRNTVGFTWHPVTRELWFTDNGADNLGDDMPSCELNRAPKDGLHFGYPYCHQGDTLDREHGKGKRCEDYVPPAAKLGPHVAPLGVRFYTGGMFPEKYRNAAIVAEHGSWNRTDPIGYRVAAVFLDAEGRDVAGQELLVDGFLQPDGPWGRPVDVLVLPDGSLLISDDHAGAIHRLSFTKG